MIWFLSHYKSWLIVVSVCFAFFVRPNPGLANTKVLVPDGEYGVASAPPLPFREPQLGPLLTFGYHKEHVFPTTTDKWIDVDLSEQRVVAYEGVKPVRAFIVSTGLPATPTVQGTFRIRLKVRSQTMSGPGYYLPNVEWVQYFYQEYGFHGTYWHNNFGHPMSHGCVNMTNADAQWLFDWAGPSWNPQGGVWQKVSPASLGTLVVVHE